MRKTYVGRWTPTRRAMLRASAIGAVVAPFLRPFRTRADDEAPCRIITIATPIGHHNDWFPLTTGRDFQLSPITQSLEPFRDRLLFIKGLRSAYHYSIGGSGAHKAGYPSAFAGATTDGDPATALNMSIDQHVLPGIGGESTPIPSLQLGVLPTGSRDSTISYAGPRAELPPEGNARVVFDSLFGGSDPNAELQRARRQSVLDAWTGELTSLQRELDPAQRQSMDAHLTQVRALENLLTQDACDAPSGIANENDFYGNATNMPAISQQMSAIIASAFGCDITRSVALSFSNSGSTVRHSWLGHRANHHSISHDGDAEHSLNLIAEIDGWYTEQVAHLMMLLDSIPEGDGTVLDNTLIYWATETGFARSHSPFDLSVLVAGNPGGYFATGNALDLGDGVDRTNQTPLNNVMAEIATGLGVETEIFGQEGFATGQLPQIRN